MTTTPERQTTHQHGSAGRSMPRTALSAGAPTGRLGASFGDDGGGDDPDFFIRPRTTTSTPLVCRIPGLRGTLPQCR